MAGVTVAYVGLCLVAGLAYPRMLFPAPPLRPLPTLDASAERLSLPQADGTHTDAIHFPPPTGGARTVVVFHGNGETVFDGLDHAGELRRRGLGVLLVEYRGYGTTHGPPPEEEALYEDGEVAIAWLLGRGVAPDRIALWGWSLGTGVAAEMAARGHGARLVLLSPFTSIVAMGKRAFPILPVSLLMRHHFDTLAKAPRIKQPTLVVHGDADELIPLAMGEAVAQALPEGRLVRVAGGHHVDLLERGTANQPSAEALLDELAEHLGRTR
jgi:fermentation-respiration switch protein FrsA (DUF1100 family)